MATYREIKGLKVPYLDSDLPSSSASTEEGNLWYNSATGKLRAFVAFDTWATTAPLVTARVSIASVGTQTAAAACGGSEPPNSAKTEEYDGSGWAAGGDINTARAEMGGMGTQTAGMICGSGSPGVLTEKYDGSSWTAANGMNTGRILNGAAGTQTAGLTFGGDGPIPSPANQAVSEEYDGTNWAEGNNLNTALKSLVGSGFGTQDAAVRTGGAPGAAATAVNTTEIYDGTSWYTSSATLGTACYSHADAGSSTSTAGLIAAGGNTSGSVITTTQELAGVTTAAEAADIDFD